MAGPCLVLILVGGLLATAPAAAKPLTREVPPNAYRSNYGYTLCQADALVEPTTTAEVSAAIKQYATEAAAAGKALKVRVSRNHFHSSAVFPCPNQVIADPIATKQQPRGPPPQGQSTASINAPAVFALGIMNSRLNGVLEVDPVNHRMRVGTGMDLNELFAAATANNMSVPNAILPAYAGLTLGGILTTSSHGSGDLQPSTLIDAVVSATWVDAAGETHNATKAGTPEEWRALHGGLGLLGVITELELQLTPTTNTQLKTILNQPDEHIYETILELLKRTPHVLIFWRPDMKRFSAFLTSIAPPDLPVTPEATMTLLPDMSQFAMLGATFSMWQKDIYDADPLRSLFCSFPPPVPFIQQLTVRKAWASRGRNGPPLYDVVGPTNQMQSAECGEKCPWNFPGTHATAQDAEFTVEFEQLQPWIEDVQGIIDKDLHRNGTRPDRCQGGGYIWLRFGQGSDDYLATQQGMKRPVYLQSTWLRNIDFFEYPMRYGYVTELIELMTLCKYKGRPHWGKNHPRTFTYPRCPVRPLYPKFDDLLALQSRVDPQKVFEPLLFTKLVNNESYVQFPRCAAAYECYCEADEHCAPEWRCLASFAEPSFKVCKPPADWDPRYIQQGLQAFQMNRGTVAEVAKEATGRAAAVVNRARAKAGLTGSTTSSNRGAALLPAVVAPAAAPAVQRPFVIPAAPAVAPPAAAVAAAPTTTAVRRRRGTGGRATVVTLDRPTAIVAAPSSSSSPAGGAAPRAAILLPTTRATSPKPASTAAAAAPAQQTLVSALPAGGAAAATAPSAAAAGTAKSRRLRDRRRRHQQQRAAATAAASGDVDPIFLPFLGNAPPAAAAAGGQ